MCCLIYKVLCRCLIGRNFIISHCLHFVKHFFQAPHSPRQPDYYTTPESSCQHLFSRSFQAAFAFRYLLYSITSEPLCQDLFLPLNFPLSRDSLSILPYISPVVNCFFHNFQLFFLFFDFFCPIPTFSTTFHTHSTDLSTVLPHIDTLTPIWYI